MPNELYRDYIDGKADEIINSLGGTITPAPVNAELYRDFLDRKFDDVINACNGITKVKSFTYTGAGTNPHELLFPDKPTVILSIFAPYQITNNEPVGIVYMDTCIVGLQKYVGVHYSVNDNLGVTVSEVATKVEYDDVNNKMIITGNNSITSFNRNNLTYTVYYI